MTEQDSRRVFFALWPTEEARQALDLLASDVVKRCGGRRMRRDSLHLTLVFIGAVSSRQLAVVQDVAGEVRGEPFDIFLDLLGCWLHNRIVWAGCSKVPSRQRRLFDLLNEGLKAAGFALDNHPFTPHVTLAHKARCDDLPELGKSIFWRVSEFVLVESLLQPSGARYRILARWSLLPAPEKKITEGC